MHFNNFTCECRITKQSGVKKLPSNNHVCSFTVVHEGPNEEKLWLNCSMFSTEKRAEFLGSLKPGQPIYLSGKLKPDTYNGKQSFKFEVNDFGLPPFKNGNKSEDTPRDTNGNTSVPDSSEPPQPPSHPPLDDIPF